MIELTGRQQRIVDIVQESAPITGDQIADRLSLSKPTIRADLSLLVMTGYLSAKPKVGYFLGPVMSASDRYLTEIGEMKVKDVQSVPVVVYGHTTIHEAVVTLFLEDVGTLLVINSEGALIGIVSRKDLLKVTLGDQDIREIPVSLMMTREPNMISVSPEDRIIDAVGKMVFHEIDSLPVIKRENNELVGRISKTTIVRVLFEAFDSVHHED
ncbi:helix-turn-helix transcriptional regulator [Paenibacillus urinalis]|uniref:Helix-turn-helix transcriptional regulator n=1 Tax=Paenibacillus urinalis TaxID=521520 RepID=A0AAX3N7E8_9BACL|nr:helix-turn-helix transcriptional regulator [Paenibacillus urinalis]WDH84690.1 helix-turn-helix transcriptional regulator [Paenibacillus urinalis]